MRRTALVCAGLFLGTTLAAGGQTGATGPLSGSLRTHVQNERFGIVTSVRGLPLGVREMLQRLFASPSLDIAEPGADFQSGDDDQPGLPTRRLVAAGCSTDHCLVYYERGGRAHTWQVLLFHWTPAATRLEWSANAPGTMTSIDDVRKGVLAGTVKDPVRGW